MPILSLSDGSAGARDISSEVSNWSVRPWRAIRAVESATDRCSECRFLPLAIRLPAGTGYSGDGAAQSL